VLELAEDTKLETYPQRFKFTIFLTTRKAQGARLAAYVLEGFD
jgi:hypothetical protein